MVHSALTDVLVMWEECILDHLTCHYLTNMDSHRDVLNQIKRFVSPSSSVEWNVLLFCKKADFINEWL